MSEQRIIDRDTYRAIKKMSREEPKPFWCVTLTSA